MSVVPVYSEHNYIMAERFSRQFPDAVVKIEIYMMDVFIIFFCFVSDTVIPEHGVDGSDGFVYQTRRRFFFFLYI